MFIERFYATTRYGLREYSPNPIRLVASAKGNIPLSECEFCYFSITIVSLEYRWRSTMSRRSSDISETMP